MPVSAIAPFLAAKNKNEAKSERKRQVECLVGTLMTADAATFKTAKPELERLVVAINADETDSRYTSLRANEERARRGDTPSYGPGAFLRAGWRANLRGKVEEALAVTEAKLGTVGDANTVFETLRQRNQLKAIVRSLNNLR